MVNRAVLPERPDEAPIGIFTALAWEGAAVRSVLRQVTKIEPQIWRGSTERKEVFVITGGVGPRRTRQIMERFVTTPFCAILSVGCAGALAPQLSTGHLILASKVHLQSSKEEEGLACYPVDPNLLECLRTAALSAGVPQAEGELFTSPRILFTPEEKAWHGQRTGAVAVEMESGVHAEFAEKRGLPFLALRVILDGVDVTIPAVAGLTTPEGEVRYLKAIGHLATHPSHFPVFLSMKRARVMAAESISRLCHELFARW